MTAKRNRHPSNIKRPYGTELQLSSGFTIFIKPLPPYYIEVIEDVIPLPEYPKRKITLASGDIIDWDYHPSEVEPSIDDADHDLWFVYKTVDLARQDVIIKRRRARQDFLLINCVSVVNGPSKLEDTEWASRLEATFDDFVVPSHYGKRLLLFLKAQVITTPNEMEMIIQTSISEEVAMQGVISALQGFPVDLGQGTDY